jgi:hydrogenase maturation protease
MLGDTMKNRRPPVLVLGIGNILLSDEGVGPYVIKQLASIGLPETVELVDGGTGGADLLDIVADRKKLIVVDAVDADCTPGSILKFTADDLMQTKSSAMSLHELGLAESLAMAKQINSHPEQVIIFGIKPKTIECSMQLSEEIRNVVPQVIQLVLAEVNNTNI